jgi:hypothetical protein
LGERLGSGDGERKTLLTRQIAFEPLPASVLLALGFWSEVDVIGKADCGIRLRTEDGPLGNGREIEES